MDDTYPYPASDAPPPPGFSNNYAPPVPPQNMTANAHTASTSAPGDNHHVSTWNTSQMSFRPPSFPGSGNFGAPPMPFPHPFNPALPPPQMGYPPPPGIHPVPSPGPHPVPLRGPLPGHLGSLPGPPGSLPGPSHPGPHHGPRSFTLPGPHQGPPPGQLLGSSSGPPFSQSNYRPRSPAQSPHQNQYYQKFSESGNTFICEKEMFVAPTIRPHSEDEATIQRSDDQKWINQFLETKGRIKKLYKMNESLTPDQITICQMKKTLYSTVQLVSQMSMICENLKLNVDSENGWTNSYVKAVEIKQEIQSRLQLLSDNENLQRVKAKLATIAKRKTRRQRTKQRLQMDKQQREAQIAEKDADIEKWRLKKIQEEEEKKKEEELKLTADAVLCEVRKKQADVKRIQDILKSLEKLRKLRKEAAGRKGIFTDQQSDDNFNKILEELRSVAKKRTAVYGAEERALMVMLEGEQEEERKRELELKRKRERDKQMLIKRKADIILFGDDTPPDPFIQPFRQYYTQGEESLPALIQIRREWDAFLVPADHPEGSAIPQGWVLPDPPSDQAWASALQTSDTECDDV
ncbi:programmed cell death protein 7 isoform X2 [Periophthalmus magnuspinnatus]|uniref:programmed cell death protein 7 isoform X2 n=1 Tax=Periophthalmus magnuspinnatus TaxID=409849 RepID=UPI002436304E|nr:programmed cell death protein 7 isoform X2 [Periophthalmus magnuspinnatus]